MVSWMLSRPSKSCKKTEVKGDENHGHKQAHRHWNTRARPHQEASSAHLALWVQTWPTAISSCSTLRVTSASSAVVKEMEWCLKQPPPPFKNKILPKRPYEHTKDMSGGEVLQGILSLFLEGQASLTFAWVLNDFNFHLFSESEEGTSVSTCASACKSVVLW